MVGGHGSGASGEARAPTNSIEGLGGPTVSPDGRCVAHSSNPGSSNPGGDADLLVLDLDTGEADPLLSPACRSTHRGRVERPRLPSSFMDAVTEVHTLAGPAHAEPPKVKGSRFVGDAAPVADEDEALAFVEAISRREPDASHHCWAFRLAGGRERSSDDGEPGGTAGPPILRRLQGADLVDVVVVVTRWFGGTKLGTGGLVKAYGECTAAVLEAGQILARPVLARFELTHPYELTGPVEGVLASHDARTVDAEYTDSVTLHVTVPSQTAGRFADELTEATAGQVVPTSQP